ncbi:tRNA pseudouridine(55) synthase TruB [Candidatus Latescibacterota bacterium]
MNELKGILIVNKPPDWTSHDVVKKTKMMLGGVKVGHTGTLDPFATGVLVLLIGKCTKLAKFFENDDKSYNAEITFGSATDTFDCTGKTTDTGDPFKVEMENLKAALHSFEGVSEQIPPMYSAIKVDGKRLYKLARKGENIEVKPRIIKISPIESDLTFYPKVLLKITCSKGTYIRSIADQLGKKVFCPAHLSALCRTAAGKYTLDDAVDFLSIVNSADSDTLRGFIKQVDEMDFSDGNI